MFKNFETYASQLPGTAQIQASRHRSLQNFLSGEWTSATRESWHYTDLQAAVTSACLPLIEPRLSASDYADLAKKCANFQAEHRGYIFFFIDGFYQAALSDVSGIPTGVRVQLLEEALHSPESLEPHFLNEEELEKQDPLAALNQAMMKGGLILTFEENVQLSETFYLVYIRTSPEIERSVFSRSLIVARQGAKARIVETYLDSSLEKDFISHHNLHLTFSLEEKAQVEHICYRPYTSLKEYGILTLSACLKAEASFHSFSCLLGGERLRRQIFLQFEGPKAEASLNGLSLLAHTQELDNTLSVAHNAPGCKSREVFKHILYGASKGTFQGKVIVQKGAQKTDGKMKSECLLLSDQARMNNKPELEIFADDVLCGHGATVAQLNPDEIFYLQTRGLPCLQAEALLLEAFTSESLDNVQDEEFRVFLLEDIHKWLQLSPSRK